MRQTKLTKAARGRECQVRIPGVCNGNPETTVLAHYRLAGTCGVGKKPHDLQGAWCCSACHDACDGRSPHACTTPRASCAPKWCCSMRGC